MLKKILILTSVASYNVLAMSFPSNDMKISTRIKSVGGITLLEFNRSIDNFEVIMRNFVNERTGKKLVIEKDWENESVNAHATLDESDNPVIIVNGGIARHPEMNVDGLYFILCHELGHHLGGAPKQFRGTSTKRSWSSAEGQADYFASSKCLPYFFSKLNETKNVDVHFSEKSLSIVDEVCQDYVCRRSIFAGQVYANVYASVKRSFKTPSLETPAWEVVRRTNFKHPSAQCVLDTVSAGAYCDETRGLDFDNSDYKIGSCFRVEESENARGARPRCWFSPIAY